MMRRLTAGAVVMAIFGFTFGVRPLGPTADAAAQTPSAQGAQPHAHTPSSTQDMMKMHEQMMAEMKAADSRLDALVKDMNAATGDGKVNAVAAVVTELVRQQKSMHERMGQMHQHMMGAGSMMMQK